MEAYQRTWSEVIQELGSDSEQGLQGKQVAERLRAYGPNALPEKAAKGWLWVFIEQFKDPLIYLLVLAAVIIFFVSEHHFDAFIISGILTFNAIIGTWQEGRTRSIMRSLRQFAKTTTIVIRDGQKDLIDDTALVPGDIILLQEGQRVPADARIIESNNLLVDESVLTGESQGVRKNTHALTGHMVLGDQDNMLFKGTLVLAGTGKAVVVATGSRTAFWGIHKAVEEIETDMPLKKELTRLSHWLLVFVLITCVFIFVVGFLLGNPFRELLVMTVALFICVVPEGLPIVLTLALVNGVYRMAREGMLVKRMQAVEGLGRTDVIVIDKTGTLTRNEMMVTRILTQKHNLTVSGEGYSARGEITENHTPIKIYDCEENVRSIAVASSLLNSSELSYDERTKTFTVKGDPTETAMAVFAQKVGIEKEELIKSYRKVYELPFDPALRYHAGFYEYQGQLICFVVGSFEVIVRDEAHKNMHALYDTLLVEGLRVLAVGMHTLPLPSTEPEDPFSYYRDRALEDLTFLGVVGITDAIRQEVAAVVHRAREAGIKVVMATGDHVETARYVATEVGILREGDVALEGAAFRMLSEKEAGVLIDKVTVYARVDPLDKVRIVSLFHGQKKLVAMTGDGVNDVPSIMAADLGIAMGGIGTEVAKDAADMVLLNDSFSIIIKAIEQGRHIFYTLRRVVLYFFVTNVGEIFMILFALLGQLPLPITAAQILWLNLITDGFLDMALSTEPKEEDILLQPGWLESKKRLIDKDLIYSVLSVALPMGLMAMGVFTYYYRIDIKLARTMTLVTMAMAQWFNAWNCRSETKSLFKIPFFSNRWLLVATVFVLFLQLLLLYTPFMQFIFDTVPLSISQWCLVIAISAPIIGIDEVRKYWMRRRAARLV